MRAKTKTHLGPTVFAYVLIFGGGCEEFSTGVMRLRALVEGGLVKRLSRAAFYQRFDEEVLAPKRELGQ